MLTVVTWKWNRPDGSEVFGPEYVNRLASALRRNLRAPHRFVCITDDAAGVDEGVEVVKPWAELADAPRCVRRMKQYDAGANAVLGDRFLMLDLDTVVVGDVTPLFTRAEPLVLWKVDYSTARFGQGSPLYCGCMVLMDRGALHPMWEWFRTDPERLTAEAGEQIYRHPSRGSDQPLLNHYLRGVRRRTGAEPASWSDSDGIVQYKVRKPRVLPPGSRVVTVGQADKAVMDERQVPWVRDHWR